MCRGKPTRWNWLIAAILVSIMPIAAAQAQQGGPPTIGRVLAFQQVERLPATPLAWVVDEVRTSKPVTHQHELGFVYAESPENTLGIGDQTTTLSLGMAAAIPTGMHTHGPGVYLELRLAAPDAPVLDHGRRVFASAALPGLPSGPAQLRFFHVIAPPNGGQSAIHAHSGPELIYDGVGSLVLQTPSHGNEMLKAGDFRVVPPDTPIQVRNESATESQFLTLLVSDANRPFQFPASFTPAAAVQPNPTVQPTTAQASSPAQLPKTGEAASNLRVDLVVSLFILGMGAAMLLRSRKRRRAP